MFVIDSMTLHFRQTIVLQIVRKQKCSDVRTMSHFADYRCGYRLRFRKT